MKKQAISTLIKDVLIAVVAFALISILLSILKVDFFYGGTLNRIALGLVLAGIPFGWRWGSKLFTAVSLVGIVIKLIFAVALGWLAIFVVIIGDIIRVFTAPNTVEE